MNECKKIKDSLSFKLIAIRLAIFFTFISLLLATILLFTYQWIDVISTKTGESFIQSWSITDNKVVFDRLADQNLDEYSSYMNKFKKIYFNLFKT